MCMLIIDIFSIHFLPVVNLRVKLLKSVITYITYNCFYFNDKIIFFASN